MNNFGLMQVTSVQCKQLTTARLFLPRLQGLSVASSGYASQSISILLIAHEDFVVDEQSVLVQTLPVRL